MSKTVRGPDGYCYTQSDAAVVPEGFEVVDVVDGVVPHDPKFLAPEDLAPAEPPAPAPAEPPALPKVKPKA